MSATRRRSVGQHVRGAGVWLAWYIAESAQRRRAWWKRGKFPGLLVLIGIRGRLRRHNLFDAGTLPAPSPARTLAEPEHWLDGRSPEGNHNDLHRPGAGMQMTRFGRNVPLSPYRSKYDDLDPNPRLVSDELMPRPDGKLEKFEDGNALLAAWIQFMVRDWFNHGETVEPAWLLPRPPTSPSADPPELTVRRVQADPAGSLVAQPPTYVNVLTHWWDGSHIYPPKAVQRWITRLGNDGVVLAHGHIREDLMERLPEPSEPNQKPELVPGFWVGLGLMMSIFAKEHNAICDELHRRYPMKSSEELYRRARLINTALMAKIHTVDWTAAALSHPTTEWGTKIEWWGLLGEQVFRRFGRRTNWELLHGIPGSPTKDFGVPFSITEEFAAVYRMHQMLPDEIPLYRAGAAEPFKTAGLEDLLGRSVITELGSEADLVYSFACAPAGRVTLHNFPAALRRLPNPAKPGDENLIDLAAVDVLRCRELGVPRYNDLRRALHMEPLKSIDQITEKAEWRQEISAVYCGKVDKVDLLVGLAAERLPDRFAFSDTAFRIFMLMAPRRLLSDRFFTSDYRPEVYTPVGIDWVENHRLVDVLRRHYPQLRPSLAGVQNAFKPWGAT